MSVCCSNVIPGVPLMHCLLNAPMCACLFLSLFLFGKPGSDIWYKRTMHALLSHCCNRPQALLRVVWLLFLCGCRPAHTAHCSATPRGTHTRVSPLGLWVAPTHSLMLETSVSLGCLCVTCAKRTQLSGWHPGLNVGLSALLAPGPSRVSAIRGNSHNCTSDTQKHFAGTAAARSKMSEPGEDSSVQLFAQPRKKSSKRKHAAVDEAPAAPASKQRKKGRASSSLEQQQLHSHPQQLDNSSNPQPSASELTDTTFHDLGVSDWLCAVLNTLGERAAATAAAVSGLC